MVNAPSASDPLQPQGRWNRRLIAVLRLLIGYVIVCYVLILASIPTYFQRLVAGTVPTIVIGGETILSNTVMAAEAGARGMTLPAYAAYSLVVNVIIALGFGAAGLLIAWKAQGDWFRLLAALVLLFFPLGNLEVPLQVSGYGYSFFVIGSLLWPAFLLFLYLFPNGRAVPRWSRWPMAIILSIHFFLQAVFLAAEWLSIPEEVLQSLSSLGVVIPLGFAFILFCQVYRYFRVSTPVERAQIRWFVAVLAIIVFSIVIEALLTGQVMQSTPGYGADLNNIGNLLIPASITIAILRYRLWDIDILIRKTLQYTAVTALLAFIYFGSVFLLQRLFSSVSGQQSPLALVVSTLLIAALFAPLRRRIQDGIDRRFYRRKYNAQQVLAQFARTARDETDMDALLAELERVIQETLQPEGVGVWLRETKSPKVRSSLSGWDMT